MLIDIWEGTVLEAHELNSKTSLDIWTILMLMCTHMHEDLNDQAEVRLVLQLDRSNFSTFCMQMFKEQGL